MSSNLFRPSGVRPFLRGLEYFFLMLATGILGYFVWVQADTFAFQAYENWRLDQLQQGRPASVALYLKHWLPGQSDATQSAPAKTEESAASSGQAAPDTASTGEESGSTSASTDSGETPPSSDSEKAAPPPRQESEEENSAPATSSGSQGTESERPAPPASADSARADNERLAPAPPSPAPHPFTPDGALIGRLQIPRLGLSAIVMEGISARTLRRAIGHVPGTPLPGEPGNVSLSAHRDTFFRRLKGIQPGDLITLSTVSGAVYRYHVGTTRIVRPKDGAVLNAFNGPGLNLITCYPFYYVGPSPNRFIVHADESGDGSRVGHAGSPPSTQSRAEPASESTSD